ncbi:MAG: regulator [Oscillospiraceae bacterium]|jgi:putative endoribonuclease L-PSP|nr:MAG: regulator [Oscillospiraceae bacterium]
MSSAVNTKKAPAAIGPYSQAIVTGNLVFTSGQIPINPETGIIVGENIAEQAEQVCKNISAVLEAAGSSVDKTVKTVCYLKNMEDFTAFNEVYSAYFVSRPARSCVSVKALPKDALVEIEAIAERN